MVVSSLPQSAWGTASGVSPRGLATRGSPDARSELRTQACTSAAGTRGSQQSVGEPVAWSPKTFSCPALPLGRGPGCPAVHLGPGR